MSHSIDSDRVVAVCPSCKQRSAFTFQGIQTWPAAVALKRGWPQQTRLYCCESCGTSVTEQSLG